MRWMRVGKRGMWDHKRPGEYLGQHQKRVGLRAKTDLLTLSHGLGRHSLKILLNTVYQGTPTKEFRGKLNLICNLLFNLALHETGRCNSEQLRGLPLNHSLAWI